MEQQLPIVQEAADIQVLTGFLNSLQSYSQDLVQHLQSGARLCHYTSLEGAIGIIGGGDLWLTNSRFSNDAEELNLGYRIVKNVIDQKEQEAQTSPGSHDWLRRLRVKFEATQSEQVYICCFCEENNLLSQWLGYADGGGGVSIEFDATGFTAISGADSLYGLMRLWRVFYDSGQQNEIIRKCIDYPYWPVSNEDERIPYIVQALQFFMPTFKNGDFRAEKERRLIFTPNPSASLKPQFRTRRSLLVPYLNLSELSQQSFRLPIKTVVVGPSRYGSSNVESIKMLLLAKGYPDVAVEASSTPYRG
jgi:hypothetical protein